MRYITLTWILDASTALRFHFGEILVSLPYRIAQLLLIGVGPTTLIVWQTFLLLSIMFHHSNVRLPKELEDRLARVIVTPRMHGIHHSDDLKNQDSNWSGGLTLWDALHGTLNLDVPQDEITIGVTGFSRPEELSISSILVQPFRQATPLTGGSTIQIPSHT